MITVNVEEAGGRLPALLSAVQDRGEVVLIYRDDKPVAELRAVAAPADNADPLQMHPELAATILYDPTEPASEEEWPSEFR